jgi:hypothetical protein
MNLIPSSALSGKIAGQFFTPEAVAASLVSWVLRSQSDLLLDPSCGDGAILAHHANSRGIDQDPYAAWLSKQRQQSARIDNADFFTWAHDTEERFDCAAGNPPFIRYQNFKGLPKAAAASIYAAHDLKLSGLSSSWAPFLIATASLLKPGGRMAFVVPAEIGHATYAPGIIDFLLRRFAKVQVVAVREKLFPRLSEDCWLLYCDGHGGRSEHVHFSKLDRFTPSAAPPTAAMHSWPNIKANWRGRLRPLLVADAGRQAYLEVQSHSTAVRFGDFAKIGIGYITGANDFFHLGPRQAAAHQIPQEFLLPTVRRGKFITTRVIDATTLDRWKAADEQCLLLSIPGKADLSKAVMRYLESERGQRARRAYKCRVRPVWYSVPGVVRPDYFLQYMSGSDVRLARNDVGATCTNSIHGVRITKTEAACIALKTWGSSTTRASCEFEGHPLGGGMLKLEPGEASRLIFAPDRGRGEALDDATRTLKEWRHVSWAKESASRNQTLS